MTGRDRRLALIICIALAAATLAVYAQVRHHTFVDFDDLEYIVANRHVNTGLTLQNITWAFTSAHSNNWHPLTWISHMMDVELFGLNPAGHHLMNVLFHAVNAILLFGLLARMTGSIWRSAFVAALFALHPLHVESVAWAAERKDVLSTFWGLLTLWAYVRYVEKSDGKRYGLVLLCFALGLMAKQMLVTLPFVMLLLDYWPLRRLFPERAVSGSKASGRAEASKQKPSRHPKPQPVEEIKTPKRFLFPDRPLQGWDLLLEKIPLILLSILASITVFLVQLKSGVLYSLNPFPLQVRIENALVSYIAYIGKMLWPVHLAVFYPHPLQTLDLWKVLGALALLIAITMLCWRYRTKRYGLVGWCWYLGTLVPVIGLVQVGVQAMADRYAYIPLIGLFMILTWGATDLWGNRPYRKPVLAVGAAVILILCTVMTWKQAAVWQDREILYTHAVRTVPNNYWAYNNLGAAVFDRGRMDESLAYFAKSLEIMPLYPGANKNMAVMLYKQGRYAEALPYVEKALIIQPRNPEFGVIRGLALMKLGRYEEAQKTFVEVLANHPSDRNAREALEEAEGLMSRAKKKP